MKETFMLKMNQIIDRNLCKYRGMERTHRHNLEKVKKMKNTVEKMKVKVPIKKTKIPSRKIRSCQSAVMDYVPNFTTKGEIEKKIKEKGLMIGTRQRRQVKMFTWKQGNMKRETVTTISFQIMNNQSIM